MPSMLRKAAFAAVVVVFFGKLAAQQAIGARLIKLPHGISADAPVSETWPWAALSFEAGHPLSTPNKPSPASQLVYDRGCLLPTHLLVYRHTSYVLSLVCATALKRPNIADFVPGTELQASDLVFSQRLLDSLLALDARLFPSAASSTLPLPPALAQDRFDWKLPEPAPQELMDMGEALDDSQRMLEGTQTQLELEELQPEGIHTYSLSLSLIFGDTLGFEYDPEFPRMAVEDFIANTPEVLLEAVLCQEEEDEHFREEFALNHDALQPDELGDPGLQPDELSLEDEFMAVEETTDLPECVELDDCETAEVVLAIENEEVETELGLEEALEEDIWWAFEDLEALEDSEVFSMD